MAITRPAKKTTETFIGAAPDAGRKGVIRGRREQITLTIAPDLLGAGGSNGRAYGAEPSRAHQPVHLPGRRGRPFLSSE